MKIKTRTLVISTILAAVNISTVFAASDIKVPFNHGLGNQLYDENCSSCHGIKLNGTDQGPPLIHAFYKPSHHGDSAFYKAALKGARAHHWKFGDMQPVKGITSKMMDRIVPYIRFYQKQMKLY